MGTPAFMGPEQAYGKTSEIGPQTDIWATGAVLFTLASGQYVHEGESAQTIVIQAATTPARSLASVMPGAPREVVHLVDIALAYEKASRWANAEAMKGGIVAAAKGTFGASPDSCMLADLLSGPPARAARPPVQPPALSGPLTTSEEDAATPIHTPASSAHAGRAPRKDPGLVTERPVITDRFVSPRWLTGKAARVAAAGGALALVAGGVVMMRGSGGGKASAPEPASDSALASSTSTSIPTPTPTPTSTSTSTPTPTPTPTSTSTSTSTRTPTPPPHSPKPAPADPHPIASPPAPKPNCTPPFTLDPTTGKKKWKAECL
jgi:hypothetical protein